MLLGAQDEDVGLYAHALQLLHGVLRWLCLQLAGSLQVGYVCKMNVDGILAHLPFHLSDCFHERSALNVADSAADLGDDEVVVILLSEELHVAFYLVGDVRHNLDCLAQIVATTLLVDNRLVDASGSERIGLSGLYASKAFVVAEVEVGFHAVNGDVAFSVLVGVECSRVDVNVRVKFLDSDVVTSCLQELTD